MGRQISPLALNLSKGIVAIVCLVITILLIDPVQVTLSELAAMTSTTPKPIWLLLTSGIVGIGIGDTAYFAALNQIGARRTIMLEALAPPLTAVLATLFLRERLGGLDWLAILLVDCQLSICG